MKEKVIPILCLTAGFIVTLIVAQLIYTLTLRQWIDHKTAKVFLNIGWIYLCMYVCYRLIKRYIPWGNPPKEKKRIIKT